MNMNLRNFLFKRINGACGNLQKKEKRCFCSANAMRLILRPAGTSVKKKSSENLKM